MVLGIGSTTAAFVVSKFGSGSFVAVEYDTLMDVEFKDIDSNHVDLDLNSMVSSPVGDLGATNIDRPVRQRHHVRRVFGVDPGKHRDPQRRVVELQLLIRFGSGRRVCTAASDDYANEFHRQLSQVSAAFIGSEWVQFGFEY